MNNPYDTLRNVLRDNLSTVIQLLESDEYPHLTKLLQARGAAKGNRLLQLIDEAMAYDPQKFGTPPSIDENGVASVMLPRGRLIAQHQGSCSTWDEAIKLFCVLGLMQQHKPDNHSEENNTQAQKYSVKFAKSQGGRWRAATWYTFPRYTPRHLREADTRAGQMQGRPATKDATRDTLGVDIANRAHDTAYGMHPETAKCRERLREAAEARLQAQGYFYPSDVMEDVLRTFEADRNVDKLFTGDKAVQEAEDRYIKERKLVTRTWKDYEKTLLDKMNLTKGPPTKAEASIYNLQTKKHIIRPTRRSYQNMGGADKHEEEH